MRLATTILALVLLVLAARAELLDRIAITVGKDVITEQQIYEQLRIAAFLDGVPPEFTQQQLRDTADRMVLQRLVLQDMEANGFPLPTNQEVDRALRESREKHWGSITAFEQAARQANVSTQAVTEFLKRLIATIKYIDFRFKPAVRISDATLLERYETKYNPLDPEAGDPPEFDEVRQALEDEIIAERVDEAVDRWLQDARERAGVRYMPEVIP
jgi:hypothetical protein